MVASTNAGDSYTNPVALVYVFNLIVGVGALTLPKGFQEAGLALGIVFLAIIGFLAYITVTWINEAQANANALITLRELGLDATDSLKVQPSIQGELDPSERVVILPISTATERDPLLLETHRSSRSLSSVFEIKRRTEMGLMSELFLGKIGQKIFYIILVIYLYGDLAIYAVTIPTSVQKVTQGWSIGHLTISNSDVYYVYLFIFAVFIIPWSFFNFQKTKILQICTLATRNISLFAMIIISLIYIGQGHGASAKDLPFFNIQGLPALFGVSIYAFMCHHSLPGLLTPVKDKSKINHLLGADFVAIFMVYAGLCSSALFAFGNQDLITCEPHPSAACQIQPLFTLNFSSYNIRPIAYFLSLYPVFTLSTNFPLIAITLRNNLMLLIPFGESRPRLRSIGFALISTVPPICLAFATKNVDILVSVTGSYAGLMIMFVIPAFLVLYSRKKVAQIAGHLGVELVNPHRSPFHHKGWIYFIFVICILCLALITFNHIYNAVKHK